jgi:hypothetical protein
MDIAVGDAPPNRVVFELFADIVPKTVEKCARSGDVVAELC